MNSQAPQRALAARTILQHHKRLFRPSITHRSQRYASSSSPSSSNTSSSSKAIHLEQPDKFRPPSHPARLNARKTTSIYGSSGQTYQGGYNQEATTKEKEEQRKRTYPHMFPEKGTFMHWFLTNKLVHLWITLGVLGSLATFTLTQSFLQTSPFAHLLPPLASFPWHPIRYIQEFFSVIRLHIDYNSEKTAEMRRQNILDAQKRRLYRRAHGMENMDVEEDMGIDVRGLVSWDDGLTNREREKGGRRVIAVSGKQMEEMAERGEMPVMGEDGRMLIKSVASVETPPVVEEQPQKRKVKRWFGIWE